MSHYAKAALDEVFGSKGFVNEIAWKRQSAKSGAFEGIGQYGRIHEAILFYTKERAMDMEPAISACTTNLTLRRFTSMSNLEQRENSDLSDLTAAGSRKGDSGGSITVNDEKVFPAAGRHWALGLESGESVQDAMNRLVSEKRIWHEPGKMPQYKRYLDEMPGVMLQDIWTDIRLCPATKQ